jgi:hypothetical protein
VGVKRKQKSALFHGQVQQVKWSERMPLLTHIFSHRDGGDVESCCGSRKFPLYQVTDLPPEPVGELTARPIIIIGHAISGDFQSLSKAGFDITDAARVVATIDTQKLAREMAHILLPEEEKFRIGDLESELLDTKTRMQIMKGTQWR